MTRPLPFKMYFIAVYTNKVKDYCDKKFFDRLRKVGGDIFVVDNTPGLDYTKKLQDWGFNVTHVNVDYEPKDTLFQRNVHKSVNLLRDKFLESGYRYFIIVESDVLVPVNLIDLFDRAMTKTGNWGAIGGFYHRSVHNFNYAGIDRLYKTQCALSGCTLYNRTMLQLFNFRWDSKNPGMFPDACWSHDVVKYTQRNLYNYGLIVCDHMDKGWGDRGHKNL